jgi:flavin reductase ActVB
VNPTTPLATTPSWTPPGPDTFRAALAQHAGGVVVVTTTAPDGEPRGFTATAFCSVSLDPPLVLVCLARTSTSFRAFHESGGFAVSLLHEGQRALATRFATSGADKFGAGDTRATPLGFPALDEALTVLDCAIQARHPAGDHVILVGAVRHILPGRGKPLVHHDHALRGLAMP